jgi:hypothetical protein
MTLESTDVDRYLKTTDYGSTDMTYDSREDYFFWSWTLEYGDD